MKRKSSPESTCQSTEYTVPGLTEAADIIVDEWGIAHIRASNRADVFFVQGFNAGRDRLWQLDIWRKRGLGLLAADYGPGYLAQDRSARLFLYRGDMESEWAAYSTPDALMIAERFAAGVNAYILLIALNPDLMPEEFKATGTQPLGWEPADVVRIRSHALSRNVLSEVARARIYELADFDTDLARESIEPVWTPIIPDGLNQPSIPADVLATYRLAGLGMVANPDRLAATIDNAWNWTKVTGTDIVGQGSNGWAVAPSRTASGRAILSCDPHRAHSLPSLRYIVHLTCPEMDVIGAGEPVTPGISLGHNGHAAFGLTIFPMDQEDLYIYETSPDDPELYRYGNNWERMLVVPERVEVRGVPDAEVLLKFSRHGPIVYEDLINRRAFAVRTVMLEPGSSPYFNSLASMQARSPAEYESKLRNWSAPSTNHLYADSSGNIAWFVAGRAPVRKNWDGLLPVPGDGRYEWSGYFAGRDLPSEINPAHGFIASANEMNLPPDFVPIERRIGFEWAERSRANRIKEVLDMQRAHTIEQSIELQTDSFSIPARRLCALLMGLSATRNIAIGLDLFQAWDYRLSCDSAAAALFEVWWSRHLKPALMDMIATNPIVRTLLEPGDNETLYAVIERLDDRLLDRSLLLSQTLASAIDECRTRLGDRPEDWRWGTLHHGFFEHPLSLFGLRNVGPLPLAGSWSSVMHAGYRLPDFRVVFGSSFRLVVDVGNWDNTRVVNAPGQSGDPMSIHYDDLAHLWAAGEYVPLLYTQDAVNAAARLHIKLIPK
ncbi:MAG: penicillin acylase family protein [Anaerolineae bacterium]